ncbi:MAG: hypothetical protein D3924_06645 [Candidatus Electrothrix sp. AR4]|nr:hypothetical protein [Candidatus Electrothrix sp. AR4]
MNSTISVVVSAVVLLFVILILYLLRKANFRIKEVKLKGGPLEAVMEPESEQEAATPVQKLRTEAVQDAVDGGKISEGSLKAPADSKAKLTQGAKGAGSSVTKSSIELT